VEKNCEIFFFPLKKKKLPRFFLLEIVLYANGNRRDFFFLKQKTIAENFKARSDRSRNTIDHALQIRIK
jgi:hypothetical protein